ncbi:MAG TPA: hypothetical protein DCZ63_09680 [Geobacter sp.]|nr:MAG: hypothetical protein A2X48_00775 [Lentisphaerae bacterium GWF2_49_21]HBA72430.1 hypothetical protein [Geobacter sp.]
MKIDLIKVLGTILVAGIVSLAGCGEKPGEKAGTAVDNAAEKTTDAVKSAAEATKDATGKAVEKTGEAMGKAGSSVEKAGADMQK